MVRWLGSRDMGTLLWIAPFFQGRMEKEALARGYHLAGQKAQRNNNPAMYVQAAYEAARKHRGDDFLLMPRGAYTGSFPYGALGAGRSAGLRRGCGRPS